MKRMFFTVSCCCFTSIAMTLLVTGSFAQAVSQKLQKAYQQFASDPQLKHAISSLYVIDAKTGKVVFDKNSQIGLAPASTQKIITSVTAFELLGKDFSYKTEIRTGTNSRNLYIFPSGDPTFGSWRWSDTKTGSLISQIMKAVNQVKGKRFDAICLDLSGWDSETIPDGWIWQDIGNYYGAGPAKLNWRENQFDMILKSGNKIGDPVEIIAVDPSDQYTESYLAFTSSEASSAKKGSGDNAYFYFSLSCEELNKVRGTIPLNEDKFRISVASKYSYMHFMNLLVDTFRVENKFVNSSKYDLKYIYEPLQDAEKDIEVFTHYSPRLDSIIYWFNKKSINLYGEALVKTIGYEKRGFGNTDTGLVIIKDFWKQKGIDEDELNIRDGSGLSPLNRVTTHAQVEILKYAKTRDWFPYFYDALPEYNGMKIKSGTISDVKGFCGYHKAKDGKEYIFSFLINNYSGPASAVVNKMYKVLDVLK